MFSRGRRRRARSEVGDSATVVDSAVSEAELEANKIARSSLRATTQLHSADLRSSWKPMLPSSAADSEPHRHFPVDRGTRSEPRSDEDATTDPWYPRPFAVSRHPWIPVTAPIQVAGGEDPPVGIFTARASHLIVLPCCTGRGASVARRTVPLGAGLADARLRSGGVSGPPEDALRREARTPAGGTASGCGPRQVDSGSRQGIRAHQKVRQAAEGVAARLGAQRPRNVSRDMPQSGPV